MQVSQQVNVNDFLLVGNQSGNSVSGKDDSSEMSNFANVLKDANNNQKSQSLDDDTVVNSKQPESNGNTKVSMESVEEQSVNLNNEEESVEQICESDTKPDFSELVILPDDMPEAFEDVSKIQQPDFSTFFDFSDKENFLGEDIPSSEEFIVGGTEDFSEEEMDIIFETVSNLFQNIMAQFDLNMEELSAKLKEFELEPSDLLDQNGLKDFFLQMNDADVSDLIVDENLNEEFKSFIGDLSEEVVLLETIEPDGFNEIVQRIVDEYVKDDTLVLETDSAEQETVVIADEPEVIVNNNQFRDEADTSGFDKRQSDNTTKQPLVHETLTKEPSKDDFSKQTTFENPILHSIHNAMNHVEGTAFTEQPVQQMDIIQQIVEQVRVNMNQQSTSMELQLYPEHLGRIQIQVVSKEGVMTASIIAETEAAKQAIEGGLLNLKEALQQQELKVEAIEVMVSTTGFERNNEQQGSFEQNHTSHTRRTIALSEMNEDIPIEDEVEIEKMRATGSSVSYSA